MTNQSFKAKIIQALVVILSISIAYYLIANVIDNLRQMELPFGFGFVKSTAGFDVSWSLIPYDPAMSYGRVYLVGIFNTLFLSAMIIVFSTILGFVVGIKLIGLSVWRQRTDYEASRASCLACGRCYKHCPREHVRLEKLKETTGKI